MKILFYLLFSIVVFSSVAAAKPMSISEVQGDKQHSPFDGKVVTVRGIVTGRVKNGFYLQTPDGEDDKNPRTSEGILIFTAKEPPVEATIGNLLEITGIVEEFRPKSEPVTLPITEIKVTKTTDKIEVISKDNPLPRPVTLTAVDFEANSLNGKLEALERYEGMRVRVTSLTVTAPTGGINDEKIATSVSDGVFYTVLTGTPRPFREPGIEFFETATLKPAPTVPIFDMNTELVRVDSDGQLGAAAIDVTTGATVKNLVGVLTYEFRSWTILPDANGKPVVAGNRTAAPMDAPRSNEFTVASFNIERLYDNADDPAVREVIVTKEAFEKRLQKASLVIREYLRTPDVLALIEVENLAVLQKLADKINVDAAKAAGGGNLKYEARLFEGSDIGGIDVGFLVNTARIEIRKVEQFGKTEKHKRPSDNAETATFDRPPLMLQAAFKQADKTINFTVVANHLKSLRGIFDEKGDTRIKKKMQSEFLARWIQKFQTENASEPLIIVGDLNAFEFSDGVVDVIGTLTGKPAPAAEVIVPTEDLITLDLTNLASTVPPAERYSYVFNGNAQILDHFLVNDHAKRRAVRFIYAHIGADFPEIYRNDPMRPERLTDHDAAIGYFSIDEVKD